MAQYRMCAYMHHGQMVKRYAYIERKINWILSPHIHTRTHTYTHKHTHMRTHTNTHTQEHPHKHWQTHTGDYTLTLTLRHTHTRIHTQAQTLHGLNSNKSIFSLNNLAESMDISS